MLQVTCRSIGNGTVYGILLAIALPGCAIKQLVNLVQVQPISHITDDSVRWIKFTFVQLLDRVVIFSNLLCEEISNIDTAASAGTSLKLKNFSLTYYSQCRWYSMKSYVLSWSATIYLIYTQYFCSLNSVVWLQMKTAADVCVNYDYARHNSKAQ